VGLNYYETLGVNRKATAEDIRRAYRRLALNIHPDRSHAPDAAERFTRITEAYETLRDPRKRAAYDHSLENPLPRPVPKPEPKPPPKKAPTPPKKNKVATAPRSSGPDLGRLAALFSRGRLEEAETLAERIIESFPREAMPYAVLGDIARARGQMGRASKFYAYAVQMDPRNHSYQHRYENLLNQLGVKQTEDPTKPLAAAGSAFAIAMLACVYIAVSKEKPLFHDVAFLSTWTLGLIVMLFLTGVATGVSLSLGRMLDRFSAVSLTSIGGVSPTVALATIAIVNYWAALGLYVLLGLTQQSFNFSTTRLMAATAGGLMMLVMGASLSSVLNPGQVALWGGNIIYLGGLSGWMVGDALRRT
jgi:curved DNA-binding protein CbpA